MKTTIKIATLALSIFYFIIPNQTKAQCYMDDWTALKALYESTNGDFWTNRAGWGTVLGNSPPANCDLGNLYGVSLDENGRVNCIDLDSATNPSCSQYGSSGGNNLTGFIPIEIEKLAKLTAIFLTDNHISGNIPKEIGNLSNLRILHLDYNDFINGNIPIEISNLTKLTQLYLSHNQLSGGVPSELGNLNNLTHLYLNNNQFNGSIPSELGNLNNLLRLSLSSNQLSGEIPIEFGNLSNLNSLYLSYNEIGGSIPSGLGNLSNLTILVLNNNQLSGNIPTELGSLNNLNQLFLSWNNLSGSLPIVLGNLANLQLFTSNNNQLNSCYDLNLINLCDQIIENFNNNNFISGGNNFDATWENFCTSGAGSCIDDDECIDDCETFVYPGDLNNDGIVNNQDVSLSGLFQYQSGIPRATQYQSIVWDAYPAQDWGIVNNQDKDIKHHDCNGDGTIDEADQQAVEDNLGLTWDTPPPPNPPNESDYQVMLQPTDQIYDGYLVMNVALERKTGGDLTVQSGYFTINYSDVEGEFSEATLNLLPTSWLGILDLNLWFEKTPLSDQKKIEVGFTKTDNTNSTGSGVIGQLTLAFDNSAFRKPGNANISYNFEVNTIGIHNSNTQFTPIENQLLQVNINSNCQPNWNINEDTPFQNEYKSTGNITTDGFVLIGADQEVEYQANRITLNSGFSIKIGNNSKFRAAYGSCN